ncbi:Hypothetical protein PHPALM_19773 [Phytophthora palmivora]|uniref:Uncharacterized protein n=1 Tax=Phytophthora palmivora TaxID=4796 RepID=A0A2P4XGI7_9STRA|nr:Hypothetical protein PHPALM_19773 [Phytophthora palmivora]
MNDAIIDVDSLFKSGLKIGLREKDVKPRVVKYFVKCDEIILQHGLPTHDFAVDSHQRLVNSASKADEQQLHHLLVKEKVLEQEKVFQQLSKRKKQMIDASKRSIQEQVRKGTSGDRKHQRVVATATSAVLPASNKKQRTGCIHYKKTIS